MHYQLSHRHSESNLMTTANVLIIDNYDSFTYTIQYYLNSLGANTVVVKNDDPRLKSIDDAFNPSHILLSPGPGNPHEAGLTLAVITEHYKRYPLLGICLGHQCLAKAWGGKIVHANRVMHGKRSQLHHNQQGLFQQLPSPFPVTRYHSLLIQPESCPDAFQITAWTGATPHAGDYAIMAIQHRHYPIFGIQYHPEAVLTQYGNAIFANFLQRQAPIR